MRPVCSSGRRAIHRYFLTVKERGRYDLALINQIISCCISVLHSPINSRISSYNNANVSVEELKQQLLQDTDFIQQIKKSVVIEEDAGEVMEERQSDGLDMDEGMLMAGLSIFENGF